METKAGGCRGRRVVVMEHLQLLQWLETTDIDLIEHRSTLAFVDGAVRALDGLSDEEFEALEGGKEMLEALEELLHELEGGGLPKEALLGFLHRFRLTPTDREPVELRMERELRVLAGKLTEQQWCTESYLTLEQGVDAYLDEGDDGPLLDALETMSEVIEQAYRPYREATVLDSEVTAESYVGHVLLREGIEHWLCALELLREEDDSGDTDWSEALGEAELGNRLLVAVQFFNEKIQRAL